MSFASRITGQQFASHPKAADLQPKLQIGPANDPLERDADKAADAVVSNQVLAAGTISRATGIQRMCAECAAEEKDTVRLQREDEEEEILTKPADAGRPSPADGAARSAADAVGSGGVPLSPAARSYFEPRFNTDLSGVRIHTHGRAQTASRSIGARAYTLGRDIAFANGQFDEGSHQGRHLLAHELAHVVQQGHAPTPVIRRKDQCTITGKSTTPEGGTTLKPDELAKRRADLQTAINRAKANYPLAATHLQHWLDGSGSTRRISQSDFDFTREGTGLPQFLRETHRACLAGDKGEECNKYVVTQGIKARLAAGHGETLQPPGTERTLKWQDSVRAKVAEPNLSTRSYEMKDPLEQDLAIALGGYTVSSVVTVRLEPASTALAPTVTSTTGTSTGTPPAETTPTTGVSGVETSTTGTSTGTPASAGTSAAGAGAPTSSELVAKVVSWKVQICDRYDWINGARAIIPIPPEHDVSDLPLPRDAVSVRENIFNTGYSVAYLKDQYLAEVERTGGAKGFNIYSEVFEAPASVKQPFKISGSEVIP